MDPGPGPVIGRGLECAAAERCPNPQTDNRRIIGFGGVPEKRHSQEFVRILDSVPPQGLEPWTR